MLKNYACLDGIKALMHPLVLENKNFYGGEVLINRKMSLMMNV